MASVTKELFRGGWKSAAAITLYIVGGFLVLFKLSTRNDPTN